MIDVSLVKTGDPFEFNVTIHERNTTTHHSVTMSESTYQNLTPGSVSPQQCIEGAFRFLLDREPKESILSCFDITVISKYFPDFENQLNRYL